MAKVELNACPQPLPHIFAAAEIAPAIDRIIARVEAARDAILKNVTKENATFETVMHPLVEAEHENSGDIGVLWMLQYGAPDMETQETFAEARRRYVKAEADWNSSDAMYELLQAARENDKDMPVESRLLLDDTLLEYKLSGCGVVNKAEKDIFTRESLELDTLLAQAQRNIAQESGGVWFDDDELQDLPADEFSRIQKGTKPPLAGQDVPPRAGMTFVPFSNGGTNTILNFSTNPAVRKKMYLADQQKLRQSIPLLQEIVKRRQELAAQLGYQTHAERRMETRLLEGPSQVQELLSSLKAGLMQRGREELDLLQRARHEELHKRGYEQDAASDLPAGFPPWDVKYYQRVLGSERKIDEAEVAEYFPLESVVQSMLRLFEEALGLRFVEIPRSEIDKGTIWHDTVQVFSAWDSKAGDFVGYLYFDLLWRENKFRGAHNVTMEFGYEKSDGSRKYPSTIVMSAFPAGDGGCVLLKHHQLITVFHELGHAIHSLVSRTNYSRFHGTSLPPDFVEMPSVMLENWCWMPEFIRSMSTHYSHLRPEYCDKWRREHPGQADPPKQLPSETAEALVKYRYSGRGLYHLYQLSISLFDLQIHSVRSVEEAQKLDVQKLWYDIRHEIEGFDFTEIEERGSELVAFHHLVGGYDVAYYAYLCCSSFAQDLFQSVFVADPMSADAWSRYRRIILTPGAEHPHLLQLLEEMLGHPPNHTALIQVLEHANL